MGGPLSLIYRDGPVYVQYMVSRRIEKIMGMIAGKVPSAYNSQKSRPKVSFCLLLSEQLAFALHFILHTQTQY